MVIQFYLYPLRLWVREDDGLGPHFRRLPFDDTRKRMECEIPLFYFIEPAQRWNSSVEVERNWSSNDIHLLAVATSSKWIMYVLCVSLEHLTPTTRRSRVLWSAADKEEEGDGKLFMGNFLRFPCLALLRTCDRKVSAMPLLFITDKFMVYSVFSFTTTARIMYNFGYWHLM